MKNSAETISDEDLIAESRAAVTKVLCVNLPEEIPSIDEKISAFVAALRTQIKRCPTYFFTEIYHAVRNLNTENPMPAFVEKFYALLDELKAERQKASYLAPYIFRPETPAKKICELFAPNKTMLEIFELTDNAPRFFVQMFQVGYRSRLRHARADSLEFWQRRQGNCAILLDNFRVDGQKNFCCRQERRCRHPEELTPKIALRTLKNLPPRKIFLPGGNEPPRRILKRHADNKNFPRRNFFAGNFFYGKTFRSSCLPCAD